MRIRLLLLSILGAGGLSAGEIWSPVAPMPRGLAGFATGVVASKLVVAGGTTWSHGRKLTLSTVQYFDPATGRWDEHHAWSRPFAFGPFGVWRDILVAWGGGDGVQTRSDRADLTDPNIRLPEAVAYAGSVVLADKLYVLGGTPDIHAVARATARFLAFDPSTGEVDALPDFPGGPRIHVALVALDGRLWAFGGGRWDNATGRLDDMADAWTYNPANRAWQSLASLPFAVRAAAIATLDDRCILLAGGHRDSTGLSAACLIYDPETDTYRAAAELPAHVMLAGLIRVGREVYLLGGEDAPKHRSPAVYHTTVGALLASTRGR